MRTIFLVIYLFYFQIVSAQTDDQKTNDDKPSWSDNMPKRQKTPDMNFDTGIDDDDVGLSRDDVFGLDDELSREIGSDERQLNNDEKSAEQEKAAELLRIADEEKAAELLRIAGEEKAAELLRIADEEKAAELLRIAGEEKAAELQRIADDEQATETQRLVEEKRIADKILEEQRIADQEKILEEKNKALELVTDQNNNPIDDQRESEQIKDEVVLPVKKVSYKWKKIANVLPQYPARAVREKKEGWVEIELELNSSGNVVGAKVANSYKNVKTFNRAALKAVRQWKYDPPLNYGITRNQFRIVRILFQL